jgi:uncharacterized ubiquitin-like protein YukD
MKLTQKQIDEIIDIISECENLETNEVSLPMVEIMLKDCELSESDKE